MLLLPFDGCLYQTKVRKARECWSTLLEGVHLAARGESSQSEMQGKWYFFFLPLCNEPNC